MIPALPGITAKILVLVEHVLDYFVTLTADPYAGNVCELAVYSGTTTTCGEQLVNLWAQALFAISGLAGEMISAMGVYVS